MAGPLLALVGPTASGKTEASIDVARSLGAEVLAVDSMLVYRGMDVGTAKPTPEQRARVPHHLLDLADPSQSFSVWAFQRLAAHALEEIEARGAAPLLVGSGGLYYRAVVDGLSFPGSDGQTRRLLETEASVVGSAAIHRRLAELDPAGAARIAPSNRRRTVRALEVAAVTGRTFSAFAGEWETYPAHRVRAAGVEIDRAVLNRRIEARVPGMMPGLLQEAAALAADGFAGFLTSSKAIGYAEAVACLDGRIGEDEAAASIVRRTRTLARRQTAWLRRDPRIRWFRADEDGAAGIVEQLVAYFAGDRPATATVTSRGKG